MRFRLFLVALTFCAGPCAGPLAAEPLHSGEMRLRPAVSLRLGPQVAPFLARLCSGGKPPGKRPGKNSATCRDLSINVPRCCVAATVLRFGIHSMQALEDGTLRAALFARELTVDGAPPITTSCGRWTYALHLDARATQPITAVTLRSTAPDATAGPFSGAFPLHARLSFQKLGGGQGGAGRVTFPVTLRLDLTGTWALTSAESALAGAPAERRLLFSIAGAESAFIAEVPEIPEIQEGAQP